MKSYVRISGAQLSKKLGRGSTNHIGSPLSVFADRIAETGQAVSEDKGALNDRQKWVVDQVAKGAQLGLRDVVAHFRGKWNRSTINRDLKELRDRGMIKVSEQGKYLALKVPSRK